MDDPTTLASADNTSVLGVSIDQILAVIAKLLGLFKKAMAWLGILVLPEDGELDEDDGE